MPGKLISSLDLDVHFELWYIMFRSFWHTHRISACWVMPIAKFQPRAQALASERREAREAMQSGIPILRLRLKIGGVYQTCREDSPNFFRDTERYLVWFGCFCFSVSLATLKLSVTSEAKLAWCYPKGYGSTMGGPRTGCHFRWWRNAAQRPATNTATWQDPKPEAGERTIAQALRGAKMERDGKKSSHFGDMKMIEKLFGKSKNLNGIYLVLRI